MRLPAEPTEVRELQDDGSELLIATRKAASASAVRAVLAASCQDVDGRSQWFWFHLPNGDLILGCYPQGETYERASRDASF